jgi:threonine dehydrogenase-like Zn-dependent dehydrogenase
MKALMLKENRIRFEDVPEPVPRENEALIRVLYSGICNTDLEIIKGYMDYEGIIGHEFVGIVESCTEKKWVGKRVVGEINLGCGECKQCRKGLSRHCSSRTVLGISRKNGAHASYLTLPVENLHSLPDSIPDTHAVFTEPLAAALEIPEQIHIRPGDKVAIIGSGKLGSLIAEVLKLSSAELTIIGRNPFKLNLLQKRGFVTQLSDNIDLPLQDIVIECSGSPEGLLLCTSLLSPRGTLVLKSTYHENVSFNPAPWVINEINLIGSRCGPFSPAIRLLQEGKIDPSYLISRIFSSHDTEEALKAAQDKDIFKILIDWG